MNYLRVKLKLWSSGPLTLLYRGYKMLQFTWWGGYYAPPLENDSGDNFWGQIDLWPKMSVKLGLEVMRKIEM